MRPALRFALVFSATAFAAYLVAGCTGEAKFYAETEVVETGRGDLDGDGQFNCIEEARYVEPSSACPFAETGKPVPPQGILVLDDFYVQPLLPAGIDSVLEYGTHPERGSGCAQDEERLSCTAFLTSLFAGSNTARASRGALPDLILPGFGQFHAAYGWWHNTREDEYIHVDDTGRQGTSVSTGPNNEWVLKLGASIVSYVEPGTHPSYDGMRRPTPAEPDVKYGVLVTTLATTPIVYQQQDGSGAPSSTAAIVWIDGSLLRSVRVTTVSDAIFSPSHDGTSPFQTSPTSLVDIDVYPAQASGTLGDLYETVAGGIMDEASSPSYGSCPRACAPGPVATGGTPLESVGAFQGAVFGLHASEFDASSANTASGRHHEYVEVYLPWIDLIPMTRLTVSYQALGLWGHSMQQPLGADARGRPTIPPGGTLSPEAWIGVFRDASEDRFVGVVADPSDPYEKGSRPMPSDYFASRGEFHGLVPKLAGNALVLTFTPDTDWGPAGVYSFYPDRFGNPIPPSHTTCYPPSVNPVSNLCPTTSQGSREPFTTILRSGTQYSPAPGASSTAVMQNPTGHFGTHQAIWFPTGSPGFTVCTQVVSLSFDRSGQPVQEDVQDCDRIEPW